MGAGELLGPVADVAGVLVATSEPLVLLLTVVMPLAEEELFREEDDTEDSVAL